MLYFFVTASLRPTYAVYVHWLYYLYRHGEVRSRLMNRKNQYETDYFGRASFVMT